MAPNFTTTHWTVVWAAAGQANDTSDVGPALESFCRSYWTPLYAFVRRRGSEPAEAQDCVQDFFLHLLEDRVLAQVGSQQGRFRTYLLRCFCNFLTNRNKNPLLSSVVGKSNWWPWKKWKPMNWTAEPWPATGRPSVPTTFPGR